MKNNKEMEFIGRKFIRYYSKTGISNAATCYFFEAILFSKKNQSGYPTYPVRYTEQLWDTSNLYSRGGIGWCFFETEPNSADQFWNRTEPNRSNFLKSPNRTEPNRKNLKPNRTEPIYIFKKCKPNRTEPILNEAKFMTS